MADTHPGDHGGNAETLHEYWVHGEGAAKIKWGTPGDHDRCVRQLVEHADFTPDQAHGYCNLAEKRATGLYPAQHAAMEKGHGRSQSPMPYTRSFPLEDISIARDGSGRVVDAYAAVFNTPSKRIHDPDGTYEEIIDPAAFNRTLEHRSRTKGGGTIPVLFNHGMTIWGTPSERYSVPIGVSEEVRVDRNGLFTRSRFHRTQAADEILEAIKDGSISGYSFRGDFLRSDPLVPHGGFRPDRSGKLQTLRRTECTLDEYGPGTFPAYTGAEIVSVRAQTLATLLTNGLSPDEAMRLVGAFQSGTPLDPPDDGTPDDSGPAAEQDSPRVRHSVRSPREEILAQRARFLIKYGGGRASA